MLQHQHQAEYYAWQGNLPAAVAQFELAVKAGRRRLLPGVGRREQAARDARGAQRIRSGARWKLAASGRFMRWTAVPGQPDHSANENFTLGRTPEPTDDVALLRLYRPWRR